jgi:hypothetical protein
MDLKNTAELLGNFGEAIGALAVIVSLVYLAVQLRQNTRVIRANAAWDSEVIYGNGNGELSRNPESALLFSRAMNPSAEMGDFSEAEQAQLYFFVRGVMQTAQAQWWLWRDGSLPDQLWEYRSRWARNFVEAPVIKEVWQAELKQHIFSASFVEDVHRAEKEGELALSATRE